MSIKHRLPAALALTGALVGAAAAKSNRPDESAAIVEMAVISFEPDSIVIEAGQAVEWRNHSDLAHTVTADPEKAADANDVALPKGTQPFDSGLIQSGETFLRTFDTPGVYRYFCIPHEAAGMKGTVVVR